MAVVDRLYEGARCGATVVAAEERCEEKLDTRLREEEEALLDTDTVEADG